MNEFFNNHHEDELFGLKEFLDRKYRILMEKIANSSVLPPDAIDIAPKSRAPFRFISFDAQKNSNGSNRSKGNSQKSKRHHYGRGSI
jgi:hypothetical protein